MRPVQCLDCKRLELTNKPFAAEGAGHCALDVSYCFVNFLMSRTCNKFLRADDSVIATRQEWSKKKFPIRLAEVAESK